MFFNQLSQLTYKSGAILRLFKVNTLDIDAFSQHFKDIQDPRQVAKITYSLFDVLFLSICSVMSRTSGWEDIEGFGEAHRLWLQEKGLFPQGVPTHNTIVRLNKPWVIALKKKPTILFRIPLLHQFC